MDIKIPNIWLKDYLDTKATKQQFASLLSSSGPTVDRTTKVGSDYVYDIEVTTNRADAVSVRGIAREAATILSFQGVPAKLKSVPQYKGKIPKDGHKLTLKSDPNLTHRLMGVVIEDIKNWESPKWMKARLEAASMRSLNSVVDITNFVMHDIGHPCHVFDYDQIKTKTIVARESRAGEQITTFDNKTHTLTGGDIVLDDGTGQIIDLPGIIGLKSTVVNKNTKRVLFFFDTNSAQHIRKTSLELGIRTNAAVLNEKGVDPELADLALKRGLILFEEICKGRVMSPIYDVYHKPYKVFQIKLDKAFIDNILGIEIKESKIKSILDSLNLSTKFSGKTLTVTIPSFRSHDIKEPIDIVEEIARIYGYQNLQGQLMQGAIPISGRSDIFKKELVIKQNLAKLKGIEVYTSSLVSKSEVDKKTALRVKNPLGAETEYLRTSLKPSLTKAATENLKLKDKFHLFELSNVYIANNNSLPHEISVLAGVLVGNSPAQSKGIIEEFIRSLNIDHEKIKFEIETHNWGVLYEFKVSDLIENMKDYPKYSPLPQYPPQIEDLTITIKEGTKVGEVFAKIKNSHKNVNRVELVDQYKRNFTFRVWYQDPNKTLTDKEVEVIRNIIINKTS